MKKNISALLACTVLLSFAACGQLTSEQTTSSPDSEKEDNSNITTETETSKVVSLEFDEVQKAVFGKLEYDESNLKKPDEDNRLKNTIIGITDMVRLKIEPADAENNEEDLRVYAYIFEFDTNSFEYKNLEVGEEVAFFLGYGFPEGAIVSAINGKYVVCLNAYKGKTGTDSYISEKTPDYTLGTLQESYNAFVELPEVFSKKYDRPEITFDYVFTKVLGNLGSSFMNYSKQDQETADNNKSVGIVNYANTMLDYPSKDKDGNDMYIFNYVRVYEFDTDSEEYKNLKVGQKFVYYIGNKKKEAVVSAINGKYVIAFVTAMGKNYNQLTSEETEPEYSYKPVQKAFDAFMSIVVT